jgi:nicotinate-nucleotide--dimethylbenzimidazole phosphoribosyltransferase
MCAYFALTENLSMTLTDLSQSDVRPALQRKLDQKTKPLGSLGRLESLALQLGEILGTESPSLVQPQLVVFAGDHGLAARGVSAYPSDVTWQMVENFLAGGACVSVLARQHGIALTVVDCGVRHDFAPRFGFLDYKIAYGTADSLMESAMSAAECERAIAQGRAIVKSLPGNVLLLGEMGIGNTSAASLLMARLTGLGIAECTGVGTGLDDAGLQRKVAVLAQVLERHAHARDPLHAMEVFGGFEMATMLGAVLQAAEERRVVVVDGFITTSVVLVAHALHPLVIQRCVFAHRSGERGHSLMLHHMGAEPLLDMGLRLGEGSGAAMAWPLLQSACLVLAEMASFGSAGVSESDSV